VAAGPDGNLWVVESTGNSVSRFEPTGGVTRFALPPSTTAPSSSIARGPDGRLWFTGRTAVGAVTTAGVVTRYPLPDATGGCPGALATHAGERVWFADYCRDRVGSVSTAGDVTWYAFAGGAPEAIAFGPGGDLWIGLGRLGQIVRMTPDGTVVDVVPLLYAPEFGGLTAGPDGNLWFSEITTPQIGRIDVPGSAAATAAAADPSAVEAPPTVRLIGTRRRGATLRITLRAGQPGHLDGRAALVRIRHVRLRPRGPRFRLRPTSLGHAQRTVTAGRFTLRVRLSAMARRALARTGRATVEVAIRLRTADRRTTSEQRRFKLAV
jgi:virginiamycin B lyase